jgi:hypothetical protein
MPNMIAGPLADVFDADTKDAWLTHGVNKFDSGAFAVNQMYFPVPAMHYLFGMMVSMPKGTMYASAWEPDVEARYMADPAAPFAVRMREYTVQENIPLLREVVALIRKFGGSSADPSQETKEVLVDNIASAVHICVHSCTQLHTTVHNCTQHTCI